MITRFVVLLLLAFCVFDSTCRADDTPPTWYVSPEGNDTWSGRLDSPNAEGTDGPLGTLAQAVGEERGSGPFSGIPFSIGPFSSVDDLGDASSIAGRVVSLSAESSLRFRTAGRDSRIHAEPSTPPPFPADSPSDTTDEESPGATHSD